MDGLLLTRLWLIFLSAMPQYTLFISNKRNRVKYPRSFDLPDADTARKAAQKLVRVFSESAPYWNELSYEQKGDFMVEITDEEGRVVLTVPLRDSDEAEG